jgi:hypothetical protein
MPKISDATNVSVIFSKIIEDVASPLFRNQMNDQLRNAIFPDNSNTNRWFNEECFEKRAVFNQMLNTYRQDKCDENRVNLVRARSNYKTCIRKIYLNLKNGIF